jgi:tRNA nucleotidyltransferase (CCA-adding enzyme)
LANSKINQICEEILKVAKPSREERTKVSITVSKVIDRLTEQIKILGVDAYPELEGSVAHGTWIAGQRDIDVFILFPLQTPLEELKKMGLEVGRQASEGRWRERYAEHPFVEAMIDDYRIDIVPCYKISKFSERVTSVDRTPLHTQFVSERIKDKERDQTILLKTFMKGIEVYGAELRVNGFSGYLCELLILHYGSLEELLKQVLKWVPQEVIDIEKHYNDKDIPRKIFPEPLIIIDPIDPTRNVAAAVSADRIAELKAAARAFVLSPSQRFFRPIAVQPMSSIELSDLLKKRGTETLFIQLPCDAVSPDVIWGELKKSTKALKRLLELKDFQVMSWGSWSDEEKLAVMVIELASASLPSIKLHEGPSAGDKSQEKFLEKHIHSEKIVGGPWIKDGKWQVELKREYTNAKTMLEARLATGELNSVGLSRDVDKWIREDGKVLLNEEILLLYNANHSFAEFLTRYYTKRPSWLR